jgi:hypothetical protein
MVEKIAGARHWRACPRKRRPARELGIFTPRREHTGRHIAAR